MPGANQPVRAGTSTRVLTPRRDLGLFDLLAVGVPMDSPPVAVLTAEHVSASNLGLLRRSDNGRAVVLETHRLSHVAGGAGCHPMERRGERVGAASRIFIATFCRGSLRYTCVPLRRPRAQHRPRVDNRSRHALRSPWDARNLRHAAPRFSCGQDTPSTPLIMLSTHLGRSDHLSGLLATSSPAAIRAGRYRAARCGLR